MVSNYFKVAYRHLARNKFFTLINVLGLSVGITAFILILQYVGFELSYDQFHRNKDQIYRIGYAQYENGVLKNTSAKNYVGLRTLLNSQFQELDSYTGFSKIPANTGLLFSYNNKIYNELGGVLNADTNFFKVFPSLLLKGDARTILRDPHNIVLSETKARKIFGDVDPLNKRLDRIDENGDDIGYIVTGVFKDIPENSHFHADFIAYQDEDWELIENYWNAPHLYTYVTIKNVKDLVSVEARLNTLIKSVEKTNPKTAGTRVFLQPLEDIHLQSDLKDELGINGSKLLIYLLSIIGFIILTIAWINYVNIETARFTTRVREVSIRRIIGSNKRDLAVQFLTEYFLINLMAGGAAWILLQTILPYFNQLTGIPVSNIQWEIPAVWIASSCLFLLGSLLVGVYPALFLLKINPVMSLKGNFTGPNRGRAIRKSLLTVQFTSSIILIAFLLVIYKQVDFMRLSKKNIDLDKVISIRNPTSYSNQELEEKYTDYKTLENRLLQNPSIKMVSSSSAIPGTEIGFTHVDLLKRNVADPYDPTRYKCLFVNYNYLPFYGLELKAGRNFSSENGEDENWKTLILNESAIRALGFNSPDEALNQTIHYSIWGWQNEEEKKYKIIGIVADYHHEAIKKEIYPTIFYLNHDSFQQVYYSIKLNANANPITALAEIEKDWKAIFPDKPFDYFFLDEYYDRQFKSELYFGRVFGLFAVTALFIASLGILGMSIFETRLRRKEISIRKILGANISGVVTLLSKEYFKLIFISTVVSLPLIYIFANSWLENYPSRILISMWVYILPVAIVFLLVALASGFQTLHAARANPVDNLKYE